MEGGGDAANVDDEDKVFYGMFNVEGVVMNDELVFVDKKFKVVYLSMECMVNGEYVRIGTWDDATQSYTYWKSAEKKKDERKEKGVVLNECGEMILVIFKGNVKLVEEFKVLVEVEYLFETDADDYCETSFEAYENVVNFLKVVCGCLNKMFVDLVIYDFYYCVGGM